MAYYSLAFFGFVLLFVILHDIIGDMFPRHQWIVRLLAGLSFFVHLSGVKVIFLIASALTIWSGALLMDQIDLHEKAFRKQAGGTAEEKKASKAAAKKKRKAVMAAVAVFNLALLVTVKFVFPICIHPIAVPIGISFYTLCAVSYTVDVYGQKYEAQPNFAKVLLYLCWFPQLIQGPINRYDLIQEDLYKTSKLHAPDIRYAVYLFLFGAIKKYAIADLLAPVVTASLNDNSGAFPGSFALFGAFMFAIEQYADFSGGIDMSMGVSLLFGVKMNENFRQPYFSTSLARFWRRWHISLGSFMRDYVFYPFVTTKPISKLNKYVSKRFGSHAGRALIGGISNILVFALVGLWHGAEKHYLLWGLYNGIIIALSDALAPAFSSLNRILHIREEGRIMYCFRVFRTFMIIVFAGYFDVIGPARVSLKCFANTLLHFNAAEGMRMISDLFTDGVTSVYAMTTAGITTAALIVYSVMNERNMKPLDRLCGDRFYKRWAVFFPLIILLLYSFTVSSGVRGFMYAAF